MGTYLVVINNLYTFNMSILVQNFFQVLLSGVKTEPKDAQDATGLGVVLKRRSSTRLKRGRAWHLQEYTDVICEAISELILTHCNAQTRGVRILNFTDITVPHKLQVPPTPPSLSLSLITSLTRSP